MKIPRYIHGCAAGAALTFASQAAAFELEEATVASIHGAFANGSLTCESLYEAYVARIARYDLVVADGTPPINAVISINTAARLQAQALDIAYANNGLTGPLHCVPFLLKDNYDTFDAPSTNASLAMLGAQAADDAFSVKGLRDAGALILGKAAQDEFAYFTLGWNGRKVQVGNPYDTTYTPGGSSSGTGASIAANFAAIGTGTDTCQSIRKPSSYNSLVGIRASLGLVSQDGITPLSHSRDVGGPMARTVEDAVIALGAMAGEDAADFRTSLYLNPRPDPILDEDGEETGAFEDPAQRPAGYTQYLDPEGLTGKTIGVLTTYGGSNALSGATDEELALFEAAVAKMESLGATIVREVELEEFSAMSFGSFQQELNEYLADLSYTPRQDLAGVLASGRVDPRTAGLMALALPNGDIPDDEYAERLAEKHAINAYVESEMDRLGLDALVLPEAGNCGFGSTTEMPSIMVPMGFITDSAAYGLMQCGSDCNKPIPRGIEIMARKWDEPTAIEIAYAYEQATQHRVPPVMPTPEESDLLPTDPELFNAGKQAFYEKMLEAQLQDPDCLPFGAYAEIAANAFGITDLAPEQVPATLLCEGDGHALKSQRPPFSP